MNRNHRSHGLCQSLMNVSARRLIEYAFRVQIVAELFRVHVVSPPVDIDKFRLSARLRNRLGGRDKCMRHGQHDIPWLNSRRCQSKTERIGAAVDPHAMFRITKLGKLALESLDLWPSDEAGRLNGLLAHFQQFRLELAMQSHQIDKRNL